MFHIGQKVVCIDDTPPSTQNGADYLPCRVQYGQIYTVREIHTEAGIPGYGIRLEEVLNPSVIWSDGTEAEWSFSSTRFRPLVDTGNREAAELAE